MAINQWVVSTRGSTSREAAPVDVVNRRPAAFTVRASGAYNASLSTTDTADVEGYGGAIGMYLYIDQTAVAESSTLGGAGVMTWTVQVKDPIGGTYTNSTVATTGTTGVGTWITMCYPGAATVAPASGSVGKADFGVPTLWRVRASASSSATNFTYSISATYIPTAGSSS